MEERKRKIKHSETMKLETTINTSSPYMAKKLKSLSPLSRLNFIFLLNITCPSMKASTSTTTTTAI
jgi:hypothetical protein